MYRHHRHSCFEHDQTRHVIQRERKCVALTRGETDETILPVDCRVFHVCVRNFMCLLARLCNDTVLG